MFLSPAAEQVYLHANLTSDFYRMLAATRKREVKLRPVMVLSNGGVIMEGKDGVFFFRCWLWATLSPLVSPEADLNRGIVSFKRTSLLSQELQRNCYKRGYRFIKV